MNKLLILIVTVAAILRFYKLDAYPVSLSWDEVAIGYNAFSIAKSGADEYGQKWPLLFKSFNDFKLPGYIYLDSLFIKVFGLSELSARIPSALLGVLAVVFTYLLTKEIFKKDLSSKKWLVSLPYITAIMLAISPWHLQFSRAAFEANGALTIVLAAVLFLFYGIRNKMAAFLALPFLSLSLYFYYSPRFFGPLILLVFLIIYRRQLLKNLKYYLYGLIIAILIVIPITIQLLTPEGFKRVREVSIFEDKSIIGDYVSASAENTNLPAKLFLNRRIPIAFEALKSYLSHFSFGFLFFGDDPNPRHRSSFHGNLYIFEIPMLLLGLWVLLRQKDSKAKYFLLAWLLFSPLPAAFAKESPHALRSLSMLLPMVIISSVGMINFAKNNLSKTVIAGLVVLFFINYLYSYYLIYPLKNSESWAYGYKEMFQSLAKLETSYDRVIVTGHFWKPYVFYLFYRQFDPALYHSTPNQESIGKYRFGTTAWDSGGKDLDEQEIDRLSGQKTLVALSPSELSLLKDKKRFVSITQVIDYAGKKEVFLIGEWR